MWFTQEMNLEGGWKPAPTNAWLDPALATNKERHLFDVEPFNINDGKVIDQTVSVLRLAPGARLLPHCGSTNGYARCDTALSYHALRCHHTLTVRSV